MSSSTVTIPTDSFYYAKRWMGMFFIGISVIVLSLDNTILNVAIPTIARDLNASTTDLQWIVDGYVLVFAAFLLTMGTFGDRIGRKRALQVGLILFGVGSLAAALSPTTLFLTLSRMFLGIAGALMMPATLSIVSSTFQEKERPQAIAIWAALFGLGVGIGPLIGGFLVERFGWHSVFLINLPVIATAVIGGQMYLGETREPDAPPPDIIGSILSIIGLFALIYGIIEASVVGWTQGNVIGAFAAALVFLGVFGVWESRATHPMLPLHLFKNPAFTGANITLTLLSFSLFGAVFFVPQFLQSVIGYTPGETGVLLLPLAISLTIMSSRSAWIAQRLGTKRTVALGVAMTGTAFLYMAFAYRLDTTFFPVVFIGQVFQAAGIGLAISPATTAVMSSVPMEKAGVGSAMNDTTRQLGGALGVAILGTVATGIYLHGVSVLQGQIPPEAYQAVANGLQTALRPETQALIDPAILDQVLLTARTAFMDGMTRAFFVGAIVMYGSALFALAVLPDVVRKRGQSAGEQSTSSQDILVANGQD